MNDVLKAIADPTRREILALLRERPKSAGELGEHFNISAAAMSKHFTILKHADLIEGERRGTQIYYQLNLSVLEEALAMFWRMFSGPTKNATKEP